MSSKVIVFLLVLVLGDKYSSTCMSNGLISDILRCKDETINLLNKHFDFP